MKRILTCVLLSSAMISQAKSILCKPAGVEQLINIEVPQKMGDLPDIDFPYETNTIIFSFRDNNLLLVAMDAEDKSRPRLFISAQAQKNHSNYQGQFMADFGGNQIQLENGAVLCQLK
ncbi:hypothetical protein [Legionella jordanis]|uniref:C-type lysozyme inhibitor domain-containing protein n=1 Tax=Legionella jordanis TaxID=456 RepID=A0A0W0VE98_9GAMM|nr:hypothetical protein [Legionella jordanis]KTD17961.1 hypothetical protein Ljor_2267 [Legionella jordanis]RMX02346.1 hypothetical protein EAW55_08810 [Legionella jordanis]RMX15774.1 hypothetical protein EAS68_11725 [Legionella jordanis]VEH13947.1 Uncharacterised protein [Legionella jordanis]HAT8714325.1 hypothetical protein [Legionella jordanis]